MVDLITATQSLQQRPKCCSQACFSHSGHLSLSLFPNWVPYTMSCILLWVHGYISFLVLFRVSLEDCRVNQKANVSGDGEQIMAANESNSGRI